MNTEYIPDPLLLRSGVLLSNAVSSTFSGVVFNTCDRFATQQFQKENTEATKTKIVETVRGLLQNFTKLYGFTMNEQNSTAWTADIINFILANFYNDGAFQRLPFPILFPPNVVPSSLFRSMAENFDPRKMDIDCFIMLTAEKSGDQY